MGYKGAWSGIVGFGVLFTFWLISVIGEAGFYLGVFVIIILLYCSNNIYKEHPKQIEKNMTQRDKYEMTKFCKTADEVHDILFYDKVIRAANGFARKKGLKYPDKNCYCLAITSYTQEVMYRGQPCFPEILKENGCVMVYYKPIIRTREVSGIKCVYNLGKIFVLAVSDEGLHKLNIPNEVNYYSMNKYGWPDGWLNEAKTTRISDIRWTIENQRL